MIAPRVIDVDGKQVVVKLMDDSWTFNQCVYAHPFKPRTGVVWSHNDHCSRLPVPGDELPEFMGWVRHTYGNCAALAWHGEVLLGHIVFLPKIVARERRTAGWEHFGSTDSDGETLVVINLAMCSLSGHEFRRKGIGRTLVQVMLEWAMQNAWKYIEVYDTGGGIFPAEWLDHCIPPRPFWEKQGFVVFQKQGDGKFSEGFLQAVLNDNPRNSDTEQRQKEEIIRRLREGAIDEQQYAFHYDLRLTLE